MLGKVDIYADVFGGGRILLENYYFAPFARGDEINPEKGYNARAGSLRFAIAKALQPFVDSTTRERMRIGEEVLNFAVICCNLYNI